jgi:hypothetical protein
MAAWHQRQNRQAWRGGKKATEKMKDGKESGGGCVTPRTRALAAAKHAAHALSHCADAARCASASTALALPQAHGDNCRTNKRGYLHLARFLRALQRWQPALYRALCCWCTATGVRTCHWHLPPAPVRLPRIRALRHRRSAAAWQRMAVPCCATAINVASLNIFVLALSSAAAWRRAGNAYEGISEKA